MPRISALLAILMCLSVSTSVWCQEVPGTAVDKKFDAFTSSLDLEVEALEFTYKAGEHQGSTVGFHVAEPGHRKSGTFAPMNTSNNIEAEVVAYRLARFLGISNIYNPVTYYRLGPKASRRFRTLLQRHPESDPDRRTNRSTTSAELNAHPTWLVGTYRSRPRGKKYFAASLATETGHLNENHPLAGFIRANGPSPSDKLLSLSGVRGQRPEFPKPAEKEIELARQLSDILVLDQLLGQWDRFFNNLEAFGDANGRLQFLARDNGGATIDDWEWYRFYDKWVSRYDLPLIARLRELSEFIQGRAPGFAGFDNIENWKTAVGFMKVGSFSTFKRKLELLIDSRVPELEKKFGDRVYFQTLHVSGEIAKSSTKVIETAGDLENKPKIRPFKPASPPMARSSRIRKARHDCEFPCVDAAAQ